MADRTIMGIRVKDRVKNAPKVQSVLSEYGCNIKTRLGLHDVSESECSSSGLLVLDVQGDQKSVEEMEAKLRQIEGIELQKMVFKDN